MMATHRIAWRCIDGSTLTTTTVYPRTVALRLAREMSRIDGRPHWAVAAGRI